MLEGDGAGPLHADKQPSPEAKMYREAAIYDKTLASRQSADKSLVRPVIDSKPYLPAATKLVKKTPLGKLAQLQMSCGEEGDEDDDDLKITEDIPDCDNEVDEKEDKVSDAGTYTIEADLKEGKEEEQEARQRIDQVFGVDLDNFSTEQPSIDPLRLASPGGYDNVYDTGEDGERTPLDENHLSPVEDDDTDLTVDDDYNEEVSAENVCVCVISHVVRFLCLFTLLEWHFLLILRTHILALWAISIAASAPAHHMSPGVGFKCSVTLWL